MSRRSTRSSSRQDEAMAAPVMTRRQRTATNMSLPELSLSMKRRARVALSDAPSELPLSNNVEASTDHDNQIVVLLKSKKRPIIPDKDNDKPAKRRRSTPELPAGVKLVNPHYSSGTDEDEMEEADTPVVGQGFPASLRTLEKDTALMKKQFPGLDVDVIEQVLVDTIPKQENQHSYNAILTEAAARLEKLHEEVVLARRRTLRHVD